MGALADLELSAEDIEGAAQELADQWGTDATTVLSLAREQAGGSRDTMALATALSGLALAGYADDGLIQDGHRRWPCDTPDRVSHSWRELQRESHRYSAADLATAKQALMDAAAGFGFQLNDPGAALSAGELDPWGNTPESYYEYNAGPGGMAAPTVRTARGIAESFVKTYSPEWYRQQELRAAANVRYDPANPEHLQLAADGVADQWAEGEVMRLSDAFAAGSGPRRPPQMTSDRAEAESVRLTNALYDREHPRHPDVTRRPPAEQRARDREQLRQAIGDQLELSHALAANPGSDEALRLSADFPSYDGAAPPSQAAPTDPRVAAYLRKFASLNSTKAQARNRAGKFHTGVISQGQGTDQNGLASLDDADVLDLREMLRQWSAAVGELKNYDANTSYAPPDISDSVTGRLGYKPGVV